MGGQLDDTQNLSLRSNDYDHEDDLLNGKGQENIKSIFNDYQNVQNDINNVFNDIWYDGDVMV